MLLKAHCSSCYVKDGMYISLGAFPAGGWTLRWFRDNIAYEEKKVAEREGVSVYQILDREATESPPGAAKLLFLPHLAGSGTGQYPAMNPYSRGALLGLHLTHRKSDIIRAVLEGLTFELRQIIESFEEVGLKVGDLRSIGGGANSPFWLQLKADITQRRVIVPVNREAAVMGAVILAGVGCRAYHDVDEGVQMIFKERDIYTPDRSRGKVYDNYYYVYKKVYPTLLQLFDEIKNL
jgi:xylulokinase